MSETLLKTNKWPKPLGNIWNDDVSFDGVKNKKIK